LFLINENLNYLKILIFITIALRSIFCVSQNVFIYGQVKDFNGNALPLVSIMNGDSSVLTTSDNKGYYNISVQVNNELKLIFSHVSYMLHKVDLSDIPSDSLEFDVVLYNRIDLEETVIECSRAEAYKLSTTSNISLIKASYIEDNLRGSLYSSLENLPGVQAAYVGGTMSRPLIRGMGGYRIVLAKNFLKQEEHFWNTHQGVATEQYVVESIELIKGPASLFYGSDAIAGVLNTITLTSPKSEGISGDIYFTGKSNNEYLGVTGKINALYKDFFVKTVCSYNSYADYKVPADSFEYKPMHFAPLHKSLTNSAGKEYALYMQAGMKHKRGNSSIIFSHYRHKAGFFAFGAGQELVNADTAIHSINRRDILLPSSDIQNNDVQYNAGFFSGRNTIKVLAGLQQYTCYEYDHIVDITGVRTNDFEKFSVSNLDLAYKLNTLSGQISHTHNDTGRYTITNALSAQYQKNAIDGFNHLLPQYTRFTSGIYSDHRYKISKDFTWQGGIRFDYGLLNLSESINPNPVIGDSVFNAAINNTYPSLTYATGLIFSGKKNVLVKINLGKSFRMPSAYELGSYGIHRHNLRFEKGLATLNPEEAYQTDLLLEINKKNSTIVISPFVNYFSNYIYLTPTPDFALGTFTGQIYEYHQNKAMHSGAEASVLMNLPYQMHLLLAGEYVYAVNMDTRRAIPYTPPFSLICEVFYLQSKGLCRLGLDVVYVASQNLVAINEYPTPSYTILNLKGRKEFRLQKQSLIVHIAVHNLLNKSYLNHLSYYRRLQIPEPGRNIQLSIQWPINKNKN